MPFDGPLDVALRYGDQSAWMRQAFEAFLERLGELPPVDRREIKMNLLDHQVRLLREIERLAPDSRGRSLLMRSFAYYKLGLDLQRQPIDVDDLADRLLAAMGQRGFEVSKESIVKAPTEEELAVIMASVGQFHVK